MVRDVIDSNDSVKPNDSILELLRRDFPGCFTKQGAFDMERFCDLVTPEVRWRPHPRCASL